MSQPKEYTIFLDPNDGPNGSIEYLHLDLDGMDQCGPRRVERASEVEYDDGIETVAIEQRPHWDNVIGVEYEDIQVREPAWVARLNDGREIARHVRRDEVLRQERAVIDDMLRRGEPIPARQS